MSNAMKRIHFNADQNVRSVLPAAIFHFHLSPNTTFDRHIHLEGRKN